MSGPPKHRILPDKESKLFKELLTQYELKQYKKGLKAADTILKKFPNHGETLALKALTIQASLPTPATVASLPKQEEAEQLARTAVKKDITSHITWHVLGILAKGRKDWEEASRAFAMARKQDSDNVPLIRDSISLSLHTRQYAQAVSARHHYLLLRPQIRSSWLGLMTAHQLNGDVDEALQVHDGYMNCVKTDGATAPERAQTVLHVIRMCMEEKRWEEAMDRLEKGLREGWISPRGEVSQMRAEILVKLDRRQEAEDAYRQLIEQNADNREYYRGFLRTKGLDITQPLDTEAISKVLSTLSSFAELYPRSAAPRRLALDIAQGDAFRGLARTYLIAGLERGIPSLFVDVKGLYVDAERMRIVGEIVEEIVSRLEKDSGLHDDDSVPPPTTLLWAYYYLALHLSHPLHPSPSHQRSFDLLSLALKHTPTLPELYMAKALVLKRAGDPWGAAEAMEEARSLDGQDRFLCCKAAKYWLRAGDVKKAEELMGLFTKKDVDPVTDLTDLQCLWFLQEEGDAHKRNGNLGMALKRCHSLATVFQEYEDDQYDFHQYCMRRMTLSAYISLMRYEDQLRSHPEYFKAALSAIDIYIKVFDDPSITEEKLSHEEEAERKKAAKKAQKAEQKARKAAAASADGKKEDQPIPDEDPTGTKRLKTETPLEDALKLWQPLEKLAASRVETWLAGYDILIRRKAYLRAARCLLEAQAIDPEHPEMHWRILHLHRNVSTLSDIPTPVQTSLQEILPALLPSSTSPEAFASTYLASHSSSPQSILGAARALLEVKRHSSPEPLSDTASSVLSILEKLTQEGVPPQLPVMLEAVGVLREAGAEDSQVDAFKQKCRGRLPLSMVFATEAEKKQQQQQREGKGEVNGSAEKEKAVQADV